MSCIKRTCAVQQQIANMAPLTFSSSSFSNATGNVVLGAMSPPFGVASLTSLFIQRVWEPFTGDLCCGSLLDLVCWIHPRIFFQDRILRCFLNIQMASIFQLSLGGTIAHVCQMTAVKERIEVHRQNVLHRYKNLFIQIEEASYCVLFVTPIYILWLRKKKWIYSWKNSSDIFSPWLVCLLSPGL